ncbi:MAG TPA: hypothetical protein V6D20_01910, partial [Candidatus Obscuribacterales bacterium]
MTQWTGRYAIVVSNGVLKNSSDVFAILDPDVGGAETFSVPLNSTGDPADPVTHWGAYSPLPVQVRDALLNLSTTEFMEYVNQRAEEFGREPVGSVTAFKNNVQFSEEGGSFWD